MDKLQTRPVNFKIIISCVLVMMTAACKEVLYTGLDEREANEMAALLMRYDIPVGRVAVGGTYNLEIDEERFADATEILKSHGYPKENFTDLGEVFAEQGLVATPMQERVKFLHGLNQELSQTISGIDGVVSARVHVSIPKKDPLALEQASSSASVVIRYDRDVSISAITPQIKMLVANGVEDLTYENVSVALFPVDTGVGARSLGPAAVAEQASQGDPIKFAAGIIIFLALAAGAAMAGLTAKRFIKFRKSTST